MLPFQSLVWIKSFVVVMFVLCLAALYWVVLYGFSDSFMEQAKKLPFEEN